MLLVVVATGSILVVFAIVWLSGFHCGVAETEERWSEAVSRAEESRRAAAVNAAERAAQTKGGG